ncbi:MAG TPA: DUF58 domain-containing protein [Acidobacteriota bacterium]|nr:DUF58 domain-containing protein [Acidobacteriota bacterium]
MVLTAANPLTPGLLERYRLRARKLLRPGMIGAHRTRRKGQSLEFREFQRYARGDDIRHVDWRASARFGGKDDLLVRSFSAEEQLTLVISLDTRSSMLLPEALPKLQAALWTAQALGTIALRSSDRVVLHRLFGPAAGSVAELAGTASASALSPTLKRLAGPAGGGETERSPRPPAHDQDPPSNLRLLGRLLPPAGVWLILTDLYFESQETVQALGRKIAAAQDGLRWVILVDLDSWPHEKALLGRGARRIEGLRRREDDPRVELDEPALRQVEERIRSHKKRLRSQLRRSGLDWLHWTYPARSQFDAAGFFRRRFLDDPVLERLFMREAR